MAVAYDAGGSNSSITNGVTNVTWSHTCSGSDRILIVMATRGETNADFSGHTFTATYGGVSMSILGTIDTWGGNLTARTHVFYLLAPTAGANTVSITASSAIASINNGAILGGSASFTGVRQTTPTSSSFGPHQQSGGTSVTVDATGTTVGGMVFDTVSFGGGTSPTIGANQTAAFTLIVNSGSMGSNSRISYEASNGGTVTMSHTLTINETSQSMVWELFASSPAPSFRERHPRPAMFKPGNAR